MKKHDTDYFGSKEYIDTVFKNISHIPKLEDIENEIREELKCKSPEAICDEMLLSDEDNQKMWLDWAEHYKNTGDPSFACSLFAGHGFTELFDAFADAIFAGKMDEFMAGYHKAYYDY